MHRSIFRSKDYHPNDERDVYCFCDPKYKKGRKRRELSEDYLSLFIEKNSDGTRNLRLKGNELQYRINRRVESSDMPLITKFLFKHLNLFKLDLSYNCIDDEGILALCDGYLKYPNPLEILILICCDIGSGGIHSLCKCWPTLVLKVLSLTGNKFGSEGAEDLYVLLSNTQILEHLHVGATGQDISSFPHFMGAIRLDGGKNESLKTLDVSDIVPMSKYHQPQPGILAEHLSTMFSLNNTLMEIHLQKCALDGHAIETMIIGLKENKTLMFLDLGYNKIGNFGAEKLSEYFMTAPQLQGINIAGNSIGEIGGRALSFGFPYSNLKVIDLSQNKITDQGLLEILLSIKKYQRIRVFYIFGNEIGPLSKEVLERQFMAGVYDQFNIDFQLFRTPEGLQVAKYPTNNYKHIVYNQLDPEDVRDIKIRYNKVLGPYCAQNAKINFDYYRVDHGPCLDDPNYEPPQPDPEKLRQICMERERLAALHEEEDSDISAFGVVEDSSTTDTCLVKDDTLDAFDMPKIYTKVVSLTKVGISKESQVDEATRDETVVIHPAKEVNFEVNKDELS